MSDLIDIADSPAPTCGRGPRRRSARRRGVAAALMARAEAEARAEGRPLLVLDTVTGDPAEPLYERLGWTRVGVIPR